MSSKKVHETKGFINTKELDGNLERALMGNSAFTVYAQTSTSATSEPRVLHKQLYKISQPSFSQSYKCLKSREGYLKVFSPALCTAAIRSLLNNKRVGGFLFPKQGWTQITLLHTT